MSAPASTAPAAAAVPAASAVPLQPLVFYFGRLGDMIMLTALLARLHARYGRPCYVIGGGSWTEAVYQGNPDVAGLFSFGRHVPFILSRDWRRVRRALRARPEGPVYVCEKHYRQLPRIRRMLAWAGVDATRCAWIGDDGAGPDVPLYGRLLALAARTPPGLPAGDYPLPPGVASAGPRLYVSAAERERRDAWLARLGVGGRPLVIVQPGSHRTMSRKRGRWRRTGADDKAWPLERWAELIARLRAARGDAVLMLRGSREEVPMLEAIRAAAGVEGLVIGGEELRSLFALCEVAESMISVDTGPAHAAAALGVPLVVMYVSPAWLQWLPHSTGGSPVCPVVGNGRVDQIPLEAVYDAWRALPGRDRAAPGS